MDVLTYENACRNWAVCFLAGDDPALEGELWEKLTVDGTHFLPLPYVMAALALPLWGRKGLTLAFTILEDVDLAAQCEDGVLSYVLFCTLIGERIPMQWLEDCLCFDGGDLAQGILTPHPRITSFVLDGAYTDTGLTGLTLLPCETLPQSDTLHHLSQSMEGFLSATSEPVTVLLCGNEGAGRRTLAQTLAKGRDLPLLLADLSQFTGWGRVALTKRFVLECKLMGCATCILPHEEDSVPWLEELSCALAEAGGYSFVCALEPWEGRAHHEHWRLLPVHIPLPDSEESLLLWQTLTEGKELGDDVDLTHPANSYRFTAGQIVAAITVAENSARWRGLPAIDMQCLLEGCRGQLRHALGDKARRIEPVFTWEDLVLPKASHELLKSACAQMKYRQKVLKEWGFSQKLPYGGGLSMLFSGPPGTGKTMGAQVVAGALGLELYKVDLATIVSKYVGETEKNLRIIFQEAQRSGAVLFFDEADALFGKRTEVKDAHDRYSNMEAAYLLQKIEEYSGVSVLATNYLQNIDDAFRRRLTYIIEFPFPDIAQRMELWERVFPKKTPVSEDVDWEFLSTAFELSGSTIKNSAVSAAFLAARDGSEVEMGHILLAVRRELEKSGKTLSKEDFGQYYMLLP